MNIVAKKWDEIIHKLKIEHGLSDVSFKTWIAPLQVYDVADSTVYILVPLKASVDYITQKYLLPFQVCIAEITGKEFEVKFITTDDSIQLNTKSNINMKKKNRLQNNVFEQANLNPKYTFDTFVVGGNNNFAHAASLAVAESPGEIYNPLFLYGGVGLGKTHLMHSVAHFILEKDPTKKVLYVTSEAFTNELIDALKSGKTSSSHESAINLFREKYRNIDVLLIDDIQFIIGKESTQEEFFHTFNHLHVSGKQIIISSDKPPKDLETLEARLRTRFEWGLIADISSPDYETRMAILKKKADVENLNVPNEVMVYIATKIKSNIRELEGALIRIVAYSSLTNREITVDLATEALKDIISNKQNKSITIDLIQDVVAAYFNLRVEDLKSQRRTRNVAYPRQIAMYLSRKLTDMSLPKIGEEFGGRDHTTVIHAYEKISETLNNDESLEHTINDITKKLTQK